MSHKLGDTFAQLRNALAVSELGASINFVVMQVAAVVALGADPLTMGILAAVTFGAPVIFSFHAASTLRKYDHFIVMKVADVARGAAVLLLATLLVAGVASMMMLIVIAAILSIAKTYFDIANRVVLPEILEDEDLESGNASLETVLLVSGTVGMSISGFVTRALSSWAGLAASASLYFVSAFQISRAQAAHERNAAIGITSNLTEASADEAEEHGSAKQGIAFVRNHATLFPLTLVTTATVLFSSAQTAVFSIFALTVADINAGLFGVAFAAGALAGVVAANQLALLTARFGSARVVVVALFGEGLGAALLPLADNSMLGTLTFFVSVMLAESSVIIVSIVYVTYRQRTTPKALLPDVTALHRWLFSVGQPIGAVLGGILATGMGDVRQFLWLVAGGLLISPIPLLFTNVRKQKNLVP